MGTGREKFEDVVNKILAGDIVMSKTEKEGINWAYNYICLCEYNIHELESRLTKASNEKENKI